MDRKQNRNIVKIVMFGHKRIPGREGGVEVVVEELATRMIGLGHDVTCLNRRGHHISGKKFDYKRGDEFKGIKLKSVFTIDVKGLGAFTSSIFAALKAAWGDYDVVHIHAEGPATMCWIPKIHGKRVIVTIHGLDWARAKWGGFASRYIKWGEKQAVKHADEIIVLSKGVQQYFQNEYGRNTVYIPNGVNKPIVREAGEITNKWGLVKDSYVLFVGRIVPEKGLKYLIEAWKDINTEKKLVVVGSASDTQGYFEEIRNNSSEGIIFTGFQQGNILEELYSNAYLYVLPSDLEGMPISLLEAMSYGNCCIVSDIQECREVVEDKAVLFKKSDTSDLKRVLKNLMENCDYVKKYKDISREYIFEEYDWEKIVNKTLSLYKD